MRFMRTRAAQSVLAATIGASFLLGGVANAAGLIPGPDGVIHGCYRNDGRLRVITAAQTCERNETALPWNQQGPKGDPGPAGPAGPAHVVVRSAAGTVANGATASTTAQCQSGEIATGGGAQIGSNGLGGNGGNAGAGGLGGNGGNASTIGAGNIQTGNTGLGNTGAANNGLLNAGNVTTGITGPGNLAATFLTGSAPNTAQGTPTGWTGSVTNLSGADQSYTVWVLCAS